MKYDDLMIFIHRFNVLRDKIRFGIELNSIDEKLLSILDEYDYYLEDIKKENRGRLLEQFYEILRGDKS